MPESNDHTDYASLGCLAMFVVFGLSAIIIAASWDVWVEVFNSYFG